MHLDHIIDSKARQPRFLSNLTTKKCRISIQRTIQARIREPVAEAISESQQGCSSSHGWLAVARHKLALPTRDPHAACSASSLSHSLSLFRSPSVPFVAFSRRESLASFSIRYLLSVLSPLILRTRSQDTHAAQGNRTEIRYDTADTPSSVDYVLGVCRRLRR